MSSMSRASTRLLGQIRADESLREPRMQSRSNSDPDALLTEVKAADLLSISIRTLQAWRSKGCGPAFVRLGRAIRYRRSDLFAWAAKNTVVPQREAAALVRSA